MPKAGKIAVENIYLSDFEYLYSFQRYSPKNFKVVPNRAIFCMFWPLNFFKVCPPKFLIGIIKLGPVVATVQNFTPVGPGMSEILRRQNKKNKIEISSKAQREFARRPKSDWGKLGKGKIFSASKSRCLNSNALAYA